MATISGSVRRGIWTCLAFGFLALPACRDSAPPEPALSRQQQALTLTAIAASGGATTFTAPSPAVVIDPNLTVIGSDPIDGAKVTISSGLVTAQDVLSMTASGGVTGSYNASTGTLTLSGTTDAATYQTVLRSVTYNNTAGAAPNTSARVITFTLGSGLYYSGTGHYYRYTASSGITWEAAKTAAAAATYFGLQGYLVTVTSSGENAFIQTKLSGQGWMGLMATTTPGNATNATGNYSIPRTWYWVTGPEAGTAIFDQTVRCPTTGVMGSALGGNYNNWASGEPNDWSSSAGCAAPGVEAYAHFYVDGTWNDYAFNSPSIQGWVAEFGGMAGDPSPVLSATKSLGVVAKTAVAVTASPNPVTRGQTSTLRATLTPSGATGTVQFHVDGADFGAPVAASAGAASIASDPALAAGSHTVTATYSGDAVDLAGTGTLAGGLTVNRIASSTAVSSSKNPAGLGVPVSFTASVTPSAATGTIQFVVDSVSSGSPVALASGSATSAAVELGAGTHTVSAVYSGDANYQTSTGALAGNQTVNAPVCGNGVVELGEQCDDGNTRPADGCSATCQTEPGWTCPGGGGACASVCGDGILTAGEQCDDGNTASGDGCSASCALESGYTCFFTAPNLIANGSFDADQTGWTSAYTWEDPAVVNAIYNAGSWSISGNGHGLHSAIAAGFRDAENSASNKAAYFNGASTPLDALDQTVNLAAGKSYVLSMYVTNWGGSGDSPYPQLSISVGGQQLTTNVTLGSSTWQRVGGTFVAAASGSNALKVIDSVTASGGNDFAVDAVILREAAAQACGRTCARDSDCAAAGTGFWCDTTAVGHPAFCTAPLPPGSPIPNVPNRNPSDPPLDGTCTSQVASAICSAGACNSAQDTCAAPLGGGCSSSAQCATDTCNSDGTCGCSVHADCASIPDSYCGAAHTCLPKASSSMAVGASPNPSSFGTPVSLTASVGPAGATGSVQFVVDGANLGLPVALVDGAAAAPDLGALPVGTHSAAAIYSGDAYTLGSSGSLDGGLVVQQAGSSTSLSVAPNPSVFGQSVHLGAQVATATAAPTGSITFLLGSSPLATVPLDGAGKAALDLASLPVGTSPLTAVYSGDVHFLSSTSDASSQVVGQAASALALASSLNPALHGQRITFTAQAVAVSPGAGTPTGTVTLLDGSTVLGVAPLGGGAASFEVSTLAVGDHAFTALYSGDANFSGTTSATLPGSVNPSCEIASQIYAPATPNPGNPCQVCDPATNSTDWTNRAQGFACPSDGLACTDDVCDGAGTCTHPVVDGCLISGACVPTNASAPTAECTQCNPALSTTAYTAKAKGVACTDDGSAITDDYCDGAGLCAHPLKNQCTIAGVTFPGGAANPDNSCQSCDPLADNAHWTQRVSGFPCADDGLSCTWDSCDGAGSCQHRLFSGCLVGGACVAPGATDPTNDCQECLPALATDTYSPRAQGVACADDGLANTLDVCDGSSLCVHPLRGQCSIAGKSYDEGTVNPDNPCQSCDPASTSQDWTNRGAGFPCTSDDLACTRDVCDGAGACAHPLFTGCLVAGACVGSGAADPADECRACNPAQSTAGYVAKAQGVSCADDGLANTLDICDGTGACVHPLKGQCTIDGATYDAGTANPLNGCQSCDPAASATAWSSRRPGFPCASDGLACTDDVCDGDGACTHPLFTGCLIAGACVSAGSLDPANDCRTCDPAASTSAYSSRASGTSCGSDSNASTLDVCDGSGSCVHPLKGQCAIGGVVYDAGAANPQNPCLACNPAASASDWTNRVSEFPCTSDGLSCTDDVCSGAGLCLHRLHTGCLIDGACVAPGVADPANACGACDPRASTSAFTPRPRGIACADDGKAATLDICDGQGACAHPLNGQCTIDGKTYDSGTPDPQNPCQACDSAASTTGWTLRVKGFPCTSDGLTCTDDTCDGAGACQHPLASGCLIAGACVPTGAADPTSGCRECNPALSASSYSLKQSTAACAGACTASADCPSGTWCADDQVCRPKLADQAACSAASQCASGYCQDTVCAPAAVAGGCGCASSEGSQAASALFLGLVTLALAARRRLVPARVRARR